MSITTTTSRAAMLAVVVAGLGYFVDIYDLILFGMVRTSSLTDLGVPKGFTVSTVTHDGAAIGWAMSRTGAASPGSTATAFLPSVTIQM